MSRSLLQILTSLLVFALIQGCGAKSTGIFFIPEESLRSQVKSLGIAEVEFDYEESDEEVAAEVKKVTETFVVDKLNKMGYFNTIGPESVGPVKKAIMEELGIENFYTMNPDTGVVSFDSEKENKVCQMMKDRLNVDSILFPKYVIRGAKYAEMQAVWDGTYEYTKTGVGMFTYVFGSFLSAFIGGKVGESGTIPAISLETKISDGEKVLWVGYGGVGLVEKDTPRGEKELTTKEIYFKNNNGNTERINKAVKLAFSSLK